MFNSDSTDLNRATITKTRDKYIVGDFQSDHSLEFTDFIDAKAAALLIESGIAIEAVTEQLVMSFKLQLVKNATQKLKN